MAQAERIPDQKPSGNKSLGSFSGSSGGTKNVQIHHKKAANDPTYKKDNVVSLPKKNNTSPDTKQERRLGADRSGLRKSSYAFDNNTQSAPGRSTIDQQVSGQYGQYASIQPSVGGISKPNNVKVDLKNPHQRRGGIQKNQSVPGSASIGRRGKAEVTEKATGAVGVSAYRGTRRNRMNSPRQQAVARKNDSASKAKKAAVRLKLMAANARVMSWVTVTASVQVILGLIALALLSLVLAGSAINDAASGSSIFSIVLSGIISAISSIGDLVSIIADSLGFSIPFIDLPGIYADLHWLLFMFGATSLFVASMDYYIAGAKLISGKGTTIKIAVFIICLAGYAIPLFHVFPWVYLWALAIMKYPR